MDGVKLITDTIELLTKNGRWAFYESKSLSERMSESCRNENPGGSRIIAV